MSRRALLRLVAIVPIAGAAAKLGIPATPTATSVEWSLAPALYNAGAISRESALEMFGIDTWIDKLEEQIIVRPFRLG